MTDQAGAVDLDPNMVELIRVLGLMPAIDIFSSCGGHDNPELSQVESGCWYVSFNVRESRAGWKALDLLTWATYQLLDVTITTWANCDPDQPYKPGALCFELKGTGGTQPDDLAEVLLDLLGEG